MHFEPEHIYHVYNRGNNKVKIFFTSANYLFLLRKIKTEWLPYSDVLCYCLMPNHFHFMLQPKPEGCSNIKVLGQSTYLQVLSKTIGKTLSSYTQAINIQNGTSGTLFQKKTKAKCLTDSSLDLSNYKTQDYLTNCFHYIHFNPEAAGLVSNLKDWAFSSWLDYYGFRNGTLCNKEMMMFRAGFTNFDLNSLKYDAIDKKVIEGIW